MACGTPGKDEPTEERNSEEELPDEEEGQNSCSPISPSHQWTEVSLQGTAPGAWMNLWGPSPDHLLVVGGQPEQGEAFLFDGDSWRRLSLPDGPMLHWAHGKDKTFFLVGRGGRFLRIDEHLEVEEFESPLKVDLWGVFVLQKDLVYAVGGDIRSPDSLPVVLRFDGTYLESIPLPELDRPANSLFKIWGTSKDHLFAVGAQGLILHFDGQQWTQMPSGTGEDLVSLWGRGPDEIVAVGGRSNALVSRFDGQGWESQFLPGLPGLQGIWMDCAGRSYINGLLGLGLQLEPRSFEWVREETSTTLLLHGSFGFSNDVKYFVGGTLDRSPPYRGILLKGSP